MAPPQSPARALDGGPEQATDSLLSNRVFDRQIRLWGVESQRRQACFSLRSSFLFHSLFCCLFVLLSSHVLLVGLTSIHVELAKNLALSGVRVTLCDSRCVGPLDFTFNFLLKQEAEGKPVAAASLAGLREMAPFVSFEELPEASFRELLDSIRDGTPARVAKCVDASKHRRAAATTQLVTRFTVICVAAEFYRLHELVHLDSLCRLLNVAFCSSHCSGKLGFGFVNFHDHIFRVPAAVSSAGGVGASKQTVNGAAAQGDEKPVPSELKELAFPSLEQMLQCNLGGADRKVDPAILVYLTMQRWEASQEEAAAVQQKEKTLARPLPFPRYAREAEDDKFAAYADAMLREQGGAATAAAESSAELISTLPMMWGRQYTVTAAIVGGVLAQELRKYITKEQEPIPNCLVFNLDTSTAAVASLPPPSSKPAKP
ncbi:hypothetical protein BESB_016540 [Besnoitia besnoiti]|uniref:THIF-type NAD/FAD binding fold domain-containing protein n=1 Tax=Besnoitia besnoiti TaxID=94643 RepID=A0A2A9M8V9_BESBE|nr:hypothetical protein BESB_016540 [Besnoitia besnoiti]PFH32336.1 hypothetical protein BESB_016540 [Besnoitia besnoiti]